MKKPGPGGPVRQPGRSSASPWGPRRSYLLVTLAIIIAAPLMWMWNDHPPEPVPEHPPSAAPATATAAPAPDEPAPAASAAAPAAPTPAAQPPASPPTPSARVRDPDGDQTPDLADYLNPGERPTMAEVIERLHAVRRSGRAGGFRAAARLRAPPSGHRRGRGDRSDPDVLARWAVGRCQRAAAGAASRPRRAP